MAQQTAVEWLVAQLQAPCRGIPSHIIEQAKQIEKEQTEISDEEIEKAAKEYVLYNEYKRNWVVEGMKLYREQLKNK